METKKERFIQAWKKVFDVDEVKDDDNFFEVGGDSMKGVQLISVLAGYGLKLDMLKLYTQPTVEELVEAAEEMEPVEIPADLINGNLSGEDIEKYLADPTIQKTMNEFGIRAEDIIEKIGTKTKGSGSEETKTGADAVPPFMGGPAEAVPPFVGLQPGAIPVQGGYLVPVPVMYYFVPVSGPDGKPAQQPVSDPGGKPAQQPVSGPGGKPAQQPVSGPVPVMAYPVVLQWPYGTGNSI